MNIQKSLQEKKSHLQQLVITYQEIQQKLNNLNIEILETNGAIKILQELENNKKTENQEVKKGEK